jgi:hypothetical protein
MIEVTGGSDGSHSSYGERSHPPIGGGVWIADDNRRLHNLPRLFAKIRPPIQRSRMGEIDSPNCPQANLWPLKVLHWS